jgi:spermidine synthase
MSRKQILFITFIVSFCSMCYELVIADALAIMTGKHIFWQAITMGIYIAAMGYGTFKADKVQNKDLEKKFVDIEYRLSMWGMVAISMMMICKAVFKVFDNHYFVTSDHENDYHERMVYYRTLFLISTQSITFMIGMLTGYELPLLIRMGQKTKKAKLNILLGLNYMGTLLGALMVPLIFIPMIDTIYTTILVAVFNIIICFYLNKIAKVKKVITRKKIIAFMALFLVMAGSRNNIQQFYLKIKYYHYDLVLNKTGWDDFRKFLFNLPSLPDVNRVKSLYQYIDRYWVKLTLNEGWGLEMALDEHFQFTEEAEKLYHEGMAHIPIMARGKVPKKVLVLGAGDGLLNRELLRYPETQILQIELDKEMVKIAREDERLSGMNEDSMDHHRLEVRNSDGFYYLRTTNEKYDAIYVDFPYPNNFNIIKLFSFEFYQYVKNALTEDGFMVVGLPIMAKDIGYDFSEKSKRLNDIYFSTFHYSGFKGLLPFAADNHTFMMASKSEINVPKKPKNLLPDKIETSDNNFKDVYGQNFPYDLDRDLVNSIFRPLLVREI